MVTCPYCDKGKITGKEADPSGKKEYAYESACHKCAGTGQLACELTLSDKVKMEFIVTNLHPRPDGKVDVEITVEGEMMHFAVVDACKLKKA